MTQEEYADKLTDPRWIVLRDKVRERAKEACEVCSTPYAKLHIHHVAYRDGMEPWEYDPSELVCLCDQCHADFHKAVKWLSREIACLHPAILLNGLKRNPYRMADCIAEIAGRMAQLSWLEIREVPL